MQYQNLIKNSDYTSENYEINKNNAFLPLKTSLNSPGGECNMKSEMIRICKHNNL